MIEIKISQGAKPGHGGILPAIKNTPEIAAARRRGRSARSWPRPPPHTAFSTPVETAGVRRAAARAVGRQARRLQTVHRPRERVRGHLQGDGRATGIRPGLRERSDGGEGGTGAAPAGVHQLRRHAAARRARAFVCDCLSGFDLKGDVRVIATGKIFTAFHVCQEPRARGGHGQQRARLHDVARLRAVARVQHQTTAPPAWPPSSRASSSRARGWATRWTASRASTHGTLADARRDRRRGRAASRRRDLNRTHVLPPHQPARRHALRRALSLRRRWDRCSTRRSRHASSARWPRPTRTTFRPSSYVARHGDGIHELDVPASA